MKRLSFLWSEISRRWTLIFENHYFICLFLFFIVIMGSIGIWFEGVFNKGGVDIGKIRSNFTTLNLLAFSAPLLVTTLFDRSMNMAVATKSNDSNAIYVQLWMILAFSIATFIVAILFGLGGVANGNFSYYSLAGCILTLCIWVLANIENPSYSFQGNTNAASGGDKADISVLGRGN